MDKTLIIGATGKIGAAAVAHLQQKGSDFTAFVRNPEKKQDLEEQGIACVLGDYTDPDALGKGMNGMKQLLLVVTPHHDMAAQEKMIIDQAKENGIAYIVKISAIGSSPDQTMHLAKSHGQSEEYLKQSGITYAILRPHSFMQNLLGNIPTIQAQGAMYHTMGDAEIPLIDARDIGEAAGNILMNASAHQNVEYDLTGPQKISMSHVAEAISQEIGTPVQSIHVPDETAKSGMMQAGFPEWIVDDLLAFNERWREGSDVQMTNALETILEHPARSIQDFVKDHAFLFKS